MPVKYKGPLLRVVADNILKHLRRFEADKNGVNAPKPDRLVSYYGTNAHASGSRVGVTYISYQGCTYLTAEEANRYLAWLDAGNVGRHFEAFRQMEKSDE